MRHLNENYSNSNSVAVLSTSTHETSKVKVYEHPLFGKVRMFVQDGKTWFCGTDIATSLGYSNTRKAILDHCKSQGVTIRDTPTNSGVQQMKFISEGNVYRLTAKSQMPKADDFESWIFDEIVPSVVNTGSYSVQPQTPQTYLEALKALVSSEEEKQRLAQEKQQLEEKNAKLQPKADFADCIMQASTCISVAEMANILKQNGLFHKGQNALYGYLRYNGYLLQRGIRRNLPSQKAIDKGVMRIAERPYITDGQVGFNRITVITPYGQKFFLQLFRSIKESNDNIMTLF